MKLMTQNIQRSLPPLYETDGTPIEEKVAIVKYFNPCGKGTWYGIEYDPEIGDFFGLVDLFECEFGYFNLHELELIELPYGLKIERDIHFKPTKIKDLPEFMKTHLAESIAAHEIEISFQDS